MVSSKELNSISNGDYDILDTIIKKLEEKDGHLETAEKPGLIAFINAMTTKEVSKEKEEELIKALAPFVDRTLFLYQAKSHTTVGKDQVLTDEQLARFAMFGLTISILNKTPEYASCVFEPEDLIICLHVDKFRFLLLDRDGVFERAALAIMQEISFAETLEIIAATIKA